MAGTTLIHEALVYDSDEEFVAALTPFLADGLRRGEAAVAAVTADNIELLRQGLGDAAAEVAFIDRDGWYQRPASTIAGWSDALKAARERGHRWVRVVGEVAFGAGARHDTWIRYESALNDVFAAARAWIVCPYDTRRLPERVITGARRTHPVVTADRRGPSELYELPDRLLRTVAEPLPPIPDGPSLTIDLTEPATVRRARHTVGAAAHALGWDRTRIDELLLVLTEVAVNSLVHGRGERRLRVWAEHAAITCEVADDGDGPADPLAGYRPPARPQRGGVGLWMANQLSDWLAFEHRDGTNRVRFRLARRR